MINETYLKMQICVIETNAITSVKHSSHTYTHGEKVDRNANDETL